MLNIDQADARRSCPRRRGFRRLQQYAEAAGFQADASLGTCASFFSTGSLRGAFPDTEDAAGSRYKVACRHGHRRTGVIRQNASKGCSSSFFLFLKLEEFYSSSYNGIRCCFSFAS